MRVRSAVNQREFSARRVAYLGLLASLAVLMGYVEATLPGLSGIPGVKPGLCNIVIVFTLYAFGVPEAFLVSVARILVIGFLFGNLFSMIYSLAGTCFAITAMALLRGAGPFSPVGVSAAGGAAHNTGQLVAACLLLPGIPFTRYLPLLLAAGCAAGAVNGLIVLAVTSKLGNILKTSRF